jgi:hypothetical protein
MIVRRCARASRYQSSGRRRSVGSGGAADAGKAEAEDEGGVEEVEEDADRRREALRSACLAGRFYAPA